jgi:hypothetical protein
VKPAVVKITMATAQPVDAVAVAAQPTSHVINLLDKDFNLTDKNYRDPFVDFGLEIGDLKRMLKNKDAFNKVDIPIRGLGQENAQSCSRDKIVPRICHQKSQPGTTRL